MAEGLIQTPEERQGTASVFGYLNLLQLLTVKKMQAEHLPIRKIRELVAGKSEQELETLLGVRGPSAKKSRENERNAISNRYWHQSGAATETSAAATATAAAKVRSRQHSWQRVEIEPGLELHIRSDYSPPATPEKRGACWKKPSTDYADYADKEIRYGIPEGRVFHHTHEA